MLRCHRLLWTNDETSQIANQYGNIYKHRQIKFLKGWLKDKICHIVK